MQEILEVNKSMYSFSLHELLDVVYSNYHIKKQAICRKKIEGRNSIL
jgi:hypothetical protein